MANSIRMHRFMQALFDDKTVAKEAARIGDAILRARSLRLTEIAAKRCVEPVG